MRNTESYESEAERFDKSDMDLDPLINGMTDFKRIAEWQAYAKQTDNKTLLRKLRNRAKELQQ